MPPMHSPPPLYIHKTVTPPKENCVLRHSLFVRDVFLFLFIFPQRSLYAIKTQLQRPSHTTYPHHKPLQTAIVNTYRYRESLNLPTQLKRNRGQTNITRNELADTAAKLVIISFDRVLDLKIITVTIGKQEERPPY